MFSLFSHVFFFFFFLRPPAVRAAGCAAFYNLAEVPLRQTPSTGPLFSSCTFFSFPCLSIHSSACTLLSFFLRDPPGARISCYAGSLQNFAPFLAFFLSVFSLRVNALVAALLSGPVAFKTPFLGLSFETSILAGSAPREQKTGSQRVFFTDLLDNPVPFFFPEFRSDHPCSLDFCATLSFPIYFFARTP